MIPNLFLLFIITIFGTAVGSFLNVLAYRSIYGGSIVRGRSLCPHCKHKLEALDLIPILSFVLLAGKCRHCKKSISWQYPVVEVFTAFLFVVVALVVLGSFGWVLNTFSILWFLYTIFVVGVLIAILATDLKDGIIPDKIIFPSLAIAAFFKIVLVYLHSTEQIRLVGTYFIDLNQLVWDLGAGLLGGVIFLLIVVASKGKGMGGGDIKYAAFLGFVLGIASLSLALFIAFLTGAAVGIILILVGRKRFGQTVPFGPFLSLGAFIALLWGQQIIDWYLKINR